MKKGFTMIELIFVIVILGILAAVAIPRLAATRDDAEVAKAATNISTILSDVGAYYTSQGKFAATLSAMTNVPLTDEKDLEGTLSVGGNGCLTIEATEAAKDGKPATVSLSATGTEALCTRLTKTATVKKMLDHDFTVSGINVVF